MAVNLILLVRDREIQTTGKSRGPNRDELSLMDAQATWVNGLSDGLPPAFLILNLVEITRSFNSRRTKNSFHWRRVEGLLSKPDNHRLQKKSLRQNLHENFSPDLL